LGNLADPAPGLGSDTRPTIQYIGYSLDRDTGFACNVADSDIQWHAPTSQNGKWNVPRNVLRVALLPPLRQSAKKATPDFVKANRPQKAEGEPRKKREVNCARKRETPTRIVEHADEQCPVCGTTLLGGTVRWSHQVLPVPIVPVAVLEHWFVGRHCPLCTQERLPLADLEEVIVGQRRGSAVTMALSATLREVGHLPVRTIPWQVETFQGVHRGAGESSEILHAARQQAAPLVAALKAEPPASPVVHGDETG